MDCKVRTNDIPSYHHTITYHHIFCYTFLVKSALLAKSFSIAIIVYHTFDLFHTEAILFDILILSLVRFDSGSSIASWLSSTGGQLTGHSPWENLLSADSESSQIFWMDWFLKAQICRLVAQTSLYWANEASMSMGRGTCITRIPAVRGIAALCLMDRPVLELSSTSKMNSLRSLRLRVFVRILW